MYQPNHYKNDSQNFVFNFIQQFPFATIVLKGNQLLATHVPVLVEGTTNNFRLFAHIAKHNPMQEFLVDKLEMLLIFKGPDAYVSSSWYSKPEVPTWDYAAVHINAKIKLQSDAELQSSLKTLIARFEKTMENPLHYQDIPNKIWEDNFKGITGFWLEPFKIAGIEKLHQGFPKKDVENISRNLKREGCPMADLAKLLDKKHDTNN